MVGYGVKKVNLSRGNVSARKELKMFRNALRYEPLKAPFTYTVAVQQASEKNCMKMHAQSV